MRTEKVFRLGRVRVDGHIIDLEPADSLTFEADRRDAVSFGVAYEYKEVSSDKEETRIRITAHLDGQKPESYEAVIGDNPLLDDSRRGFVSVPIHLPRAGEVKGRFTIEATYKSGPWKGKAHDHEATERAEGHFTLRVK